MQVMLIIDNLEQDRTIDVLGIQMATETQNSNPDYKAQEYSYDAYDKYYKRACEVCVPIIMKVPVYVAPIVIEKEPKCIEKNGY